MRAIFLLVLAAGAPAAAAEGSFGAPIADSELASMRGGFSLPNGLEVSLAVESQTMVDGSVLLRSIFTADAGLPQLAVFVPRDPTAGSGRSASTAAPPADGGQTTPSPNIALDGLGNLVVTPGRSDGSFAVRVGGSLPQSTTAGEEGLEPLAIAPGQTVDTPAGAVNREVTGGIDRVELRTDTLDTVHFFGGAFGFLTANTANDRAIDTSTTVSVMLRNASPDVIGSAILRAEGVALESARMLSR